MTSVGGAGEWWAKHESISSSTATGALEDGGEGNGLESWLIPAGTGVGGDFHRDM